MGNASAGGLAFVPSGTGGVVGAVVIGGNNTSGTTASVSSGTLFLAGGNNVTLSQNGQSVTISGPNIAGAQTGISSVIVSNTTYTSGAISFSNANGVSFGSSAGQAITASYTVPSTAGLISALHLSGGAGTSNNVTGLTFSNSNNVTFGLLTGASVGTMTASYAPPLASRADQWPAGAWGSSTITAQGSASIRYLQLDYPVTFSRVDIPIVLSLSTSATTNTAAFLISAGLVIYSRTGSTLSPIAGTLSSTSYSWASNSANFSSITGGKNLSFAIGTSLSMGEYWIGAQLSTATTSSGASTTNLGNTIYVPYGAIDTGNQYGDFGNTYSQSQNVSTQGIFSNTITATNQTLAMSNISATGVPYQAGNFPVIFRNY
jgi:hypothetical protein